ncbi:polysaccharide biosynthesis tyrosine autokinase [Nocardioides sp. dk4132]|uniref:polysaccharide biosynthesis tyrosine autokinase n=1 Tax=unclassified Nocardioides TaxID=2615069 RepID=UPI001297AAE6|nr:MULTISPECIES: polysaccharide biosynthesis tyrosine autokinase [unclassified Nocardioides]MQW78082.1 polysaccharide biosynthesis tyrosine autokinase [Nocardioides sp. dk4132]QGA09087.1 polysaccharide biosynthesis tyrosine autokinase [Nocardioides sp. dk884]
MELRDYLRLLRRRWLMILSVTAVVLAAAATLTFTATPQYQSSAQLFISTSTQDGGSGDAYQGALFSSQRVTSYAQQVDTTQLADSVIADLDLDLTAAELKDKVSADVVPDTVMVQIAATDPEPVLAQAIAQSYAEQLSAWIEEIETVGGRTPVRASLSDAASLPSNPSSPQPVRNLGLGLVLGLLLGVGLALLRELLDTTVKDPAEATTLTTAPMLGSIAYDAAARAEPLITSLPTTAPRAEAFRVIRTNLQFLEVDHAEKVVVVTSALPNEGKTSTSLNLALSLAQAGKKTLLIEGDLRRPKASAALGLDHAVGVTTVLVGKVSLEEAIQKHPGTDLSVLSAGAIPPNPAELLQSQAMTELLAKIRSEFEVVIIDAPPLLPVTDAALLASHADGALLVVRYGSTTRDQLAQSVERLASVDAKALGLVMNMVPSRRRGSSYGYGYGYGYAPEAAETGKRKKD